MKRTPEQQRKNDDWWGTLSMIFLGVMLFIVWPLLLDYWEVGQ